MDQINEWNGLIGKENKSLQRAVVVLNNLIEVVDQSRISTTNLFCGSTQIEDLKDEEDHQIDVAEEVVFDSERNRNENEVHNADGINHLVDDLQLQVFGDVEVTIDDHCSNVNDGHNDSVCIKETLLDDFSDIIVRHTHHCTEEENDVDENDGLNQEGVHGLVLTLLVGVVRVVSICFQLRFREVLTQYTKSM